MRPSRRARPTIAPSQPVPATAERSSVERTPPAASTASPPPPHTRPRRSSSGPVERSVAIDRGAEDAGDGGVAAAVDGVLDRDRRRARPPSDCDVAVPNVDRDDETIAERGGEAGERLVLGERCGPDDHAEGARLEEALGVSDGADAAGCLESCRGSRERRAPHDVGAYPSVSRAVEVDEVDKRGA